MGQPKTADEKKQRAKASKALSNARQRCTNPKHKDYPNYGAKGIKVLLELDQLIAAIGPPPKSATLDRIDPHGHYELGNVRWTSKAVQAANKKASPAGSTLPLQTLIAQQKLIAEQERLRPKVTGAWWVVLRAFNRGSLTNAENELLVDSLALADPQAVVCTKQPAADGQEYPTFRLPSLTFPNGFNMARAPSRTAPDQATAESWLRHGLLYRLREVEGAANVPAEVHSAIDELCILQRHEARSCD